jgi:inner membrane protein
MSGVLSPIYIWAIVGIILMIADVFTLTFFLFFLGIGALLTSLSAWLGLTTSIHGQLICFALSSLIIMVLFRSTVKKMFGSNSGGAEYSEYIGRRVPVTSPIPPGGEGRVTFRGSEWVAFSELEEEISAGTMVVITGVDGTRFKVGL